MIDRLLGLISPSSYAGANKRVKARIDFPYSGNKRLLHHPVSVRYLVVWSHGSVCSSHLKTEEKNVLAKNVAKMREHKVMIKLN